VILRLPLPKLIAALLTLGAALTFAQQPPAPPPIQPQPISSPAPTQSSEPAPPPGKVLFSRSLDTDTATQPADSQPQPTPPPAATEPAAPIPQDSLAVTDAERNALTFTAYDLDVHLTPASAGISVRSGLTVRNDSSAPLARLILQISSSLHWDALSASNLTGSPTPLPFTAHLIDTDADHTGKMNEAAVTLAQPLTFGSSLSLTALYSGAIPPSTERLERIGAPNDQALSADWDSIAATNPDGQTGGTALRGFGNVLWFPVSAPPVFLGDGAKLFQSVGRAHLRQSAATVRLRLAVEYAGDPPDAAFFCGRRQPLTAISDNANLPAAESPGIATALFDSQPLGFRPLSLFVTDRPPSPAGTPANPTLISAVTSHYDALPAYAAAAALVEPLLTDWLGPQLLSSLNVLDHPGQPFEDDALLVRPMQAVEPTTLAPSIAHSLTHAWLHSAHPWIDEGLAQFLGLLWTERASGRSAAITQLDDDTRSLALIEPETPSDTPRSDTIAGSSLIDATGEVFYRTKAAAVWWMLRSIVGDDALKQALQTYRKDNNLDRDPTGMQHAIENASHKDLAWFFEDWVYRDRGLPDLSIVNVTPSRLTSRAGLPTGWLVAVEVRNDGYAAADVPVTVRSATTSDTQRLRIPGRHSASTRFAIAGTPEQVEVNDGSVPETQSSIHTRQLTLPSH